MRIFSALFFILTLSILSFAQIVPVENITSEVATETPPTTPACASLDEAKAKLLSEVEQTRYEIHQQYSTWIPRQIIRDSASSLQWRPDLQRYTTGSIRQWVCGPGADCWLVIDIACDGKVSLRTIAE